MQTASLCSAIYAQLKADSPCTLQWVSFMDALHSRRGYNIFALWFLSSFFFYSSPNLSSHSLDVYHMSTHDVALMRI